MSQDPCDPGMGVGWASGGFYDLGEQAGGDALDTSPLGGSLKLGPPVAWDRATAFPYSGKANRHPGVLRKGFNRWPEVDDI